MKFCSKCGKELTDDVKFCNDCGTDVEVAEEQTAVEAPTAENKKAKENILEKIKNNKDEFSIMALCLVLAIVVFVMFFSAANSIKVGGLEIMSIESVGGKTLEEAYYQNLGYIYEGYCVAVKAIGVFCSAVLLFLGALRVKNVK